MEIRWLQDFLTVAELGNFTRAAEERHASQAAFSRRIQSLESWLGVTLIDRSVFPTRLTVEGERFKEQARCGKGKWHRVAAGLHGHCHGGRVIPVVCEKWTMMLSLVAYRDQTNNSAALRRLWAGLSSATLDEF